MPTLRSATLSPAPAATPSPTAVTPSPAAAGTTPSSAAKRRMTARRAADSPDSPQFASPHKSPLAGSGHFGAPKMLSGSPKSSRKRLYGDLVPAERPKWNPRGKFSKISLQPSAAFPCLVLTAKKIHCAPQIRRRCRRSRRRCTWPRRPRAAWFAGTTSKGACSSSARRVSSRRGRGASTCAGALVQGRHCRSARSSRACRDGLMRWEWRRLMICQSIAPTLETHLTFLARYSKNSRFGKRQVANCHHFSNCSVCFHTKNLLQGGCYWLLWMRWTT
uniref:Uncharacterized protein n=1 Tax=Aegilops tauschii subsp. strangulata TaxID=200361 RepID=A0A453FY63_AEGTS